MRGRELLWLLRAVPHLPLARYLNRRQNIRPTPVEIPLGNFSCNTSFGVFFARGILREETRGQRFVQHLADQEVKHIPGEAYREKFYREIVKGV